MGADLFVQSIVLLWASIIFSKFADKKKMEHLHLRGGLGNERATVMSTVINVCRNAAIISLPVFSYNLPSEEKQQLLMER